jgi:hypothetical protein
MDTQASVPAVETADPAAMLELSAAYTVLALGTKSVVALVSTELNDQKQAIAKLQQLKYHGSLARLKDAPFLIEEVPGAYAHIFDTTGQHELSYSTIPPQPAVPSNMKLSIGNHSFSPFSGLNFVIAPMGWGKTSLFEAIARSNTATPQVLIRFVEPNAASEYRGDGLDSYGVNYVTVQTPFGLLTDMIKRLYGPDDETAYYDSFRYFIHAQGLGGTGERGVDNLLPSQVTALGNVFMAHRRLAFAAINPKIKLTTDDEISRYDRLVDDYAGSVDTLIVGQQTPRIAVLYSRSMNLRNGISGTVSVQDNANLERRDNRRLLDQDYELEVKYDADPELDNNSFESLLRLNTMARTPLSWAQNNKQNW